LPPESAYGGREAKMFDCLVLNSIL
jgi:hypothetical protein